MIAENNIFNIRDTKQNFLGSEGSTKGFVNFKSQEYCVRAALRILHTYHRNGYVTIQQIISRWAPRNENNTSRYISFVCDCMKVHQGFEINLYQPVHLFYFLQAMSRMETGVVLYASVFDYGYSLFHKLSLDLYEKD